MTEETMACCLYAPGSYDSLLPSLRLAGPMSDLRDALIATRGKRRNEFDWHTLVCWIDEHVDGGMTKGHTAAMSRVTWAWWGMPDKMKARAKELSEAITQSP